MGLGRSLFLAVAAFIGLIAYQNCSGFKTNLALSPDGRVIENPSGGGPPRIEEGPAFFTSKVLPTFTASCNSCHNEPRFGGTAPLSVFSYSSMRAALANGPSSVNNALINKVTSVVPHTGGNRCATNGFLASPCKELVEWWQLEIQTSANGFVGSIGTIDSQGKGTGWAYDTKNTSSKLQVLLYVNDQTLGLGTLVATLTANENLATSGPTVGHWFSFTLPDSFRNGAPHNLFAYAVSAVPENLLPGAPKRFISYAPKSAGMTYYQNTLGPLLQNRCASCHVVDYVGQYYYLLSPTPFDGGTALNNLLINKAASSTAHSGGNICGNKNASPCIEMQEWWRLEFQ